MEHSNANDYMEHIRCPFCSESIVDYYDGAEIPESLQEYEYDIQQGEWDSMDGMCEHLALITDGCGGVERGKGWSSEFIEKIGRELIKKGLIEIDEDEDGESYVFDDLEEQVLKAFDSQEDFDTILDGKYEFVYDGGYYVERGMGVQGGGPTYEFLFIKEK